MMKHDGLNISRASVLVEDFRALAVLRRSLHHRRERASGGRRVTTHWAFADEMAGRYTAIDVQGQNIVLNDGDIICARGILA